LDIKTEVLLAEQRIRAHIRETPLDFSFYLSQITGNRVFLKLENLQYTGSFKLRGAMNKLLSLSMEQQVRGVVAASSGNHGAAIAYGINKLNIRGSVFVPSGTSSTKVEAIRRFGADIKFHGIDCAITEEHARRYAIQNEMIYISPYNDLHVIGGQGTIAVDIIRQLDQIDAIFIAVGGGGLISGIAGYIKSVLNNVKIIGCSPEQSPVMAESVKSGRIVEMASKPTLSDATAGGIEPGAITLNLCKMFVDEYVLVSEDEIRSAMCLFMDTHHMLIEGAAGVAIAAYLKKADLFQNKNVVIVICGANISLDTLKTII
jgi:threonine dehydratase